MFTESGLRTNNNGQIILHKMVKDRYIDGVSSFPFLYLNGLLELFNVHESSPFP